MALYVGTSKVKITADTKYFKLKSIVPSSSPVTNGVKLVSSDNHILKDSKGLYLLAKEDK
jgi:hypothetical protein